MWILGVIKLDEDKPVSLGSMLGCDCTRCWWDREKGNYQKCSSCGEIKPKTEFRRGRSHYQCKACVKEYQKSYHLRRKKLESKIKSTNRESAE